MEKIRRMINKSNRHKNKRGAAMVEFALVLPLFILLVFGIIEFGRAFYTWSLMSEAVREGARAGVVETNDTAATATAGQVANAFLAAVGINGAMVNTAIVPLTADVDAVDVQATLAFQPLGLNGIFPNDFQLSARSLMRQEGQ